MQNISMRMSPQIILKKEEEHEDKSIVKAENVASSFLTDSASSALQNVSFAAYNAHAVVVDLWNYFSKPSVSSIAMSHPANTL